MKRSAGFLLFTISICIACVSCSSGVTAFSPPAVPAPLGQQDCCHALLGLYTFTLEPETNALDVVQLRRPELHLNALKFLEPPPNLFLTLEGPVHVSGNILDVNIGLRNPYLGLLQFSGFDVCGIVFTHGSQTGFHEPWITIAGEGDTRLLNADGYTRWWNTSEFPHVATIFGYKDGLLGTPADSADFNSTVNGYKYFMDNLGPNDSLVTAEMTTRGSFMAGQQNIRHYTIDMSGGLVFNYAVDACWAIPSGGPPYDVPGDFPDNANRPEAYCISVTEISNSLYFHELSEICGGMMSLSLELRDHFNAQENHVFCESLSGLDFIEADNTGGDDSYCVFKTELYGIDLTHNGPAQLLITVQSEADSYGGLFPGEPVCAYFIYDFEISAEGPAGWARTWGSDYIVEPGSYPNYFSEPDEKAVDVDIDSEGYAYVVGYFGETADFDDTEGVDMHSSNGELDAFLAKYSPDGEFMWAVTWGGASWDRAHGIYIDENDNIFVTGDYIGTVDFDPGPEICEYTSYSNSHGDAYLSKFDSEGQYIWTKVWGGSDATIPYDVEMDSQDNIYIVGEYYGTVDFDPGPGADYHEGSVNWFDAFILKLTPDGEYVWARTYGDYGRQSVNDLTFDSLDNLYVCGIFTHTADFDPGPGEEIHTALGYQDIYLSKFDPDGNFLWCRVWGGEEGIDQGVGIATSSSDEIFACGRFVGAVDFDPTVEIDEYISNGNADAFLCKYSTSGDYIWNRVWGGPGLDKADGMTISSADELFITGTFAQTVDFDPGPGEVWSQSAGGPDTFLSKFDTSGALTWAVTWGGESSGSIGDRGYAIASIPGGNIYVAGQFEETCDFYPGPWHDIHASNGGTDAFLAKYPTDGNW